MKILSLNVASPREVQDAQGEPFETSIFKRPVDGRVMLGADGLDGDSRVAAVHEGFDRAAYVYSWDNYGIWRDELGRDDLAYGQFGENFTVEGMLDGEVHIGDIYRVGAAVVEVTHGRIPCSTLGVRMEDPGFPKTFLKSLRTGFFLRVLEPGEVGAGDSFLRLAMGPERVAVREAVELLFGARDDPEPARLAVLADLEALTGRWRDRARKLAARASVGPPSE